jgi:hypothetical protein
MGQGGLGGDDRYGLALRIDRASVAFEDLTKADTLPGEGVPPQSQPQASATPGPASPQAAPPMLTPDARKDLAAANGLLVVGALAGLLAVRAVVGAMLAAVAVPMVLALELAVMEPQLRALQAAIDGMTPLGALPMQIWASAAVFTGVMVASALGVARAATAFRFPDGVRLAAGRWAAAVPHTDDWPRLAGMASSPVVLSEGRSRAQRIADAAITAQRRDDGTMRGQRLIRQDSLARANANGSLLPPAAMPIGQAARQSERNRARRTLGGSVRRDGQR